MTTASKSKQKSRGTSRELIIDVSRSIIEDEGLEHLTIRRIADTINRTQPAVYQHFAGKDEILTAVVLEGFVALVERLKRAATGEKPSLAAIASAYVRFSLDRPRLYEVMFVAPPVIAFAVADTPMPAQIAFRIFATAVAESGVQPTEVDTVTSGVGGSSRPGHALNHEAPTAGSSIAPQPTRATHSRDRRDNGARVKPCVFEEFQRIASRSMRKIARILVDATRFS